MKNVAVFFGGVSQERDVSVLTGVMTLNSLDKNLFKPVPIYIDKDGIWHTGEALFKVSFFKNFDKRKLKRVTLLSGGKTLFLVKKTRIQPLCSIDCAINCLHGRNGEDGSLAGLLRLGGVPLASPDVFSSSASLDKVKTKIFLKGLGIESAEFVSVDRSEYFADKKAVADRIESSLDYPLIVKPSSSGSSIGISVARNREGLVCALSAAFVYDNLALVEKYLEGAEDVNCAAMRVDGTIIISECERPFHKGEILSFTDKYTSSKTGVSKEFPAKIGEDLSARIKETTKTVYSAFGFNGVVRVDYLVINEKIYLNEINGVPGSLAYYLFSPKLSDFTKNLTALVEQGIRAQLQYEGCRFEYESDVLSFKGVALKK